MTPWGLEKELEKAGIDINKHIDITQDFATSVRKYVQEIPNEPIYTDSASNRYVYADTKLLRTHQREGI